jgi:hypothetical protein
MIFNRAADENGPYRKQKTAGCHVTMTPAVSGVIIRTGGLSVYQTGESGYFPACGFLVDNAFLGGFLEPGLDRSQNGGFVFIILFDRTAEVFFKIFDSGLYGPVSLSSDKALFSAFFCRFVIGQRFFTPCLR